MFTLSEEEVRLSNVNVRPELHGEDPVTAVDLKCEANLSNDRLSLFDPDLKRCLYKRDDDKPDLFDDNEHLTKLRFPRIGGLKWDQELVGAKVTVHNGVSAKSDVVLDPCDVNNFAFEALEGGSVSCIFRIQAHPDEKQLGRLGMLAGHDVTLTIVPPPAVEVKAPESKPVKAPDAWPFPVKGSPAHIPGTGDGKEAA
jgi:hypothetical protein